jgi:hypothetical protein
MKRAMHALDETDRTAVCCAISRTKACVKLGNLLQGRWEGELGSGRRAVRVFVRIVEPSPGVFRGQLDNLTGPWLGQPMAVSYGRPGVTLRVASGAGMFDGTLNDDATEMSGVWIQGGQRGPATFKRTDAAREPVR